MRLRNILTADLRRFVESLRDLGVHVDQKIVLAGKLFVASLDMTVHPVLEWLT